MSRIGKRKLLIPAKTTVAVEGKHVKVTGPLGNLTLDVPSSVQVVVENDRVSTNIKNPDDNIIWGTVNANIWAAITGVSTGFKRELKVEGVGFKASVKGTKLALNLGQTHPLDLSIPQGLKVETPAPTEIRITGISDQAVGQFAAEIRSFYPPEPYNGKGVMFKGERVLRKVGKTAEGTKK